MTASGAEYAGGHPGGRRTAVDEQVRQKGLRPLASLDELRADGVWESDEELAEFLEFLYESRRSDLA